MRFIPTGYAIALWASAFLSAMTAAAAWSRRKSSPGGLYFAAMMGCVVIWSLAAGAEAAAVGIPAKLLFAKLGYLGICGVAPLFLGFCFGYGGRETALSRRRALLSWAIPVITFLLVVSNDWHHLVWAAFSWAQPPLQNVLIYRHGPWYWVWVAYYGAVTLLASMVLVGSALRRRMIFLRQTIVFLAGAALPWVGEALYLSRANPFPGLDLPTIGFAAMGALLLLGMSRFLLFDVVPVARTVLVEGMSDGMVVLDSRGRITDINPAAQKLLRLTGSMIGRAGDEVLIPLRALLNKARAGDSECQAEVSLAGALPTCLDLVIAPLRSRRGLRTGEMIVLRDVTFRRLEEEERERLIVELRAARDDLKVLRGLLPICCSCKKIRDDAGYWQNLENYIQANSEAHFSHGLCDECLRKLYPELSREKKEEHM